MAEDDRFSLRGLGMAVEGEGLYRSRLDELREGARVEADSIVRFLRNIPADDKRKKEELAKFFQTPDGLRYTSKERRKFYDDLLGTERNRRTHG